MLAVPVGWFTSGAVISVTGAVVESVGCGVLGGVGFSRRNCWEVGCVLLLAAALFAAWNSFSLLLFRRCLAFRDSPVVVGAVARLSVVRLVVGGRGVVCAGWLAVDGRWTVVAINGDGGGWNMCVDGEIGGGRGVPAGCTGRLGLRDRCVSAGGTSAARQNTVVRSSHPRL